MTCTDGSSDTRLTPFSEALTHVFGVCSNRVQGVNVDCCAGAIGELI